MGDIRDLTEHPEYQFHGDPFERLERRTREAVQEQKVYPSGQARCDQCVHRLDKRPWYRRWFRRSTLFDFLCGAEARVPVVNPVTGEEGFLPFGTNFPANSQPEKYHPCLLLNPAGKCRLFQTRIYYK